MPSKGVSSSVSRCPAPGLTLASATPPWMVTETAWAAIWTGSATIWVPARLVPAGLVTAGLVPAGLVPAGVVVVVTAAAAPRVTTAGSVLAGLVSRSANTAPRTAATKSTPRADTTMRPRRVRNRLIGALPPKSQPKAPPRSSD